MSNMSGIQKKCSKQAGNVPMPMLQKRNIPIPMKGLKQHMYPISAVYSYYKATFKLSDSASQQINLLLKVG